MCRYVFVGFKVCSISLTDCHLVPPITRCHINRLMLVEVMACWYAYKSWFEKLWKIETLRWGWNTCMQYILWIIHTTPFMQTGVLLSSNVDCDSLSTSVCLFYVARRSLQTRLTDRSLHLTLVTKWSQSWSCMTYTHPFWSMSIGPPILRNGYFKIWPWKSLVNTMRMVKCQGHIRPWKFKDQGHSQGQTQWSHFRPGVQLLLIFMTIGPLLVEI